MGIPVTLSEISQPTIVVLPKRIWALNTFGMTKKTKFSLGTTYTYLKVMKCS